MIFRWFYDKLKVSWALLQNYVSIVLICHDDRYLQAYLTVTNELGKHKKSWRIIRLELALLLFNFIRLCSLLIFDFSPRIRVLLFDYIYIFGVPKLFTYCLANVMFMAAGYEYFLFVLAPKNRTFRLLELTMFETNVKRRRHFQLIDDHQMDRLVRLMRFIMNNLLISKQMLLLLFALVFPLSQYILHSFIKHSIIEPLTWLEYGFTQLNSFLMYASIFVVIHSSMLVYLVTFNLGLIFLARLLWLYRCFKQAFCARFRRQGDTLKTITTLAAIHRRQLILILELNKLFGQLFIIFVLITPSVAIILMMIGLGRVPVEYVFPSLINGLGTLTPIFIAQTSVMFYPDLLHFPVTSKALPAFITADSQRSSSHRSIRQKLRIHTWITAMSVSNRYGITYRDIGLISMPSFFVMTTKYTEIVNYIYQLLIKN